MRFQPLASFPCGLRQAVATGGISISPAPHQPGRTAVLDLADGVVGGHLLKLLVPVEWRV